MIISENNLSKISVIIVLHRSTNLVLNLLKKIQNLKTIILDNGGNRHILDKIRSSYPKIQIITANRNLGFGKGINFAFKYVNTRYFIVLNPDLIIEEHDIKNLYESIINNKNCAIVAPITKPDKDFYGIFPEKGKGINRNEIQLKSARNLDNQMIEGEFCADVVKGCSMLIDAQIFKKVGMFDERFFLFWEEIELCKRLREKKYSVIICNKSNAIHKSGSSSKKDLLTFFSRAYHNELSPLFYYEVDKFSFNLFWKMIKYIFRSITYLLILNIKKSTKNVAKFLAILNFIFRLN